MKKIFILLALIISLFSLSTLAVETDCLYYFYGDDCPTCPETNTYINDLQNKYPELNINQLEIYYHPENALKLQEFFDSYQILKKDQKLPIVFMQDSYFIGVRSIKDLLEDRLLSNTKEDCPLPENKAVVGLLGEGRSPKDVLLTLGVGKITFGGLTDIFSMSILTMFLLFLAFLIGLKNHQEVLRKGAVFIIIFAVIYFLFGRGYFSGLFLPRADYWFSKVLGGAAIIFGLVLVTKFFGGLKEISRKIREDEDKLKLHLKIIKTLVSWPVVLISVLAASLLTFSNLGETFFLLRKLSLFPLTQSGALPYLLYHLFLLVLPFAAALIALTIAKKKISLKYVGKESFSDIMKESFTRQHYRALHTVLGIIMLLLGILVLMM